MLFEGEDLASERPGTWRGALFAAVLSLGCFALAGLLAYRVADWPISWSRFLGYLGAGLLVAAGLAFAYWAYACRTLCYVLSSEHLGIRFGLVWHLVPWSAVREVASLDERPRVSGLAWWGLRAGRGRAAEAAEVLAFATRWRKGSLVRVRTEDATYVLSPADPVRFVAQARRLATSRRGYPAAQVRSERLGPAALPLFGDRAVGVLLALGLALGVGLLAYLCAIYPGLSEQVNYVLPPLGPDQDLVSKKELFKLPATALALLGVNVGAGLVLHLRERAAAHLLLSGGVLMQVLFWAATLAVVSRL
ncbi:MAG TPA: PH domain-containing protein [Dehalococcoidia bacterium]|nr:PH domain-containing protein [Dehalococcoidia bacterium]